MTLSRPNRLMPMATHIGTDRGEIEIGTQRLVRNFSAAQHDDSIGNLQQLIQVLAYEENRASLVPQFDERVMDKCRGGKIKTEARILRNHDCGLLQPQIPCEHRALHITSREISNRYIQRWRADGKFVDPVWSEKPSFEDGLPLLAYLQAATR